MQTKSLTFIRDFPPICYVAFVTDQSNGNRVWVWIPLLDHFVVVLDGVEGAPLGDIVDQKESVANTTSGLVRL